jgi:hypothetical protein
LRLEYVFLQPTALPAAAAAAAFLEGVELSESVVCQKSSKMEVLATVLFEYSMVRGGLRSGSQLEYKCYNPLPTINLGGTEKDSPEVLAYPIYGDDLFALDFSLKTAQKVVKDQADLWSFDLIKDPREQGGHCNEHVERDLVIETENDFHRSYGGKTPILLKGRLDRVHFRVDRGIEEEGLDCACKLVWLRVTYTSKDNVQASAVVPLQVFTRYEWEEEYNPKPRFNPPPR